MRRAVLLCLLPLAGCGGGGGAPAPKASASAAGASYVARVAALAPPLRAGVLLRAVRDAGHPCQQVVAQAALPGGTPGAGWLATCDDGGKWVVAVSDDGTADVVDAHDLAPRR